MVVPCLHVGEAGLRVVLVAWNLPLFVEGRALIVNADRAKGVVVQELGLSSRGVGRESRAGQMVGVDVGDGCGGVGAVDGCEHLTVGGQDMLYNEANFFDFRFVILTRFFVWFNTLDSKHKIIKRGI